MPHTPDPTSTARISNLAPLYFWLSTPTTGNCLDDSDCESELVCYQTEGSGEIVPGCSGETIDDTNFCFVPTVHSGNLPLTFIGDELSSYGECEGGEFATECSG